ncbi:hypothetical protein GCM10023191_089700 [Actinoallomurus oryzae]|uniref:Tetratricopeptide repeat protein n=1 Tax=Actinoallomurus oryzae TaxID=502180 RepID=A0ABP8R3V2_9ACTN
MLSAGDVAGAALLAEQALTARCEVQDVQALFRGLAEHGGRGLFPLGDPLSAARVVARAHVVAYEGDYDYALPLLVKAQVYSADIPWAIGVPWLIGPDAAGAIDVRTVINAAVGLLQIMRPLADAGHTSHIEPYLTLARNSVALHGDNGPLLSAVAYLARYFDLEYAARCAQAGFDLAPSHPAGAVLGLTRRDQGRDDAAIAAFEAALEYDPAGVGVLTDLGELLLDNGRPEEARSYAMKVLEQESDNLCAQLTVHGANFLLTRKEADLEAIMRIQRTSSAQTHAHTHATKLLTSVIQRTAVRTAVFGRTSEAGR